MEKIVVDNILEAIHFVIKQNEFQLSESVIEKTDKEILPDLEGIDISSDEFKVLKPGAPMLSYDRRIYPVLMKYFAITQNNLSLYYDLIKNNYDYYEGQKLYFYALDEGLTSKFKNNEYIKLLEKYNSVIGKFYMSLRGLSKKEKEKYFTDFSYIVHKDQSTLRVGLRDDDYSFCNYLVKKNFDYFGRDYLLELSKDRREVLNKTYYNTDLEHVPKIKDLIDKYPNYNGTLPLTTYVLDNFSNDELANMSYKDTLLYEAALNKGLVKRIRSILEKDSNFDCSSSFIKEEIFRVLDDETIIGLSDEAKSKIIDVIPKLDDVIMMPVKKIKKIVFMDNLHKKMSGIK